MGLQRGRHDWARLHMQLTWTSSELCAVMFGAYEKMVNLIYLFPLLFLCPVEKVSISPFLSQILADLLCWLPRFSGKKFACQYRRHKRHGFDHWVGKIPWRRKQQPAPVFLPGKCHGQRSLAGYSSWGSKELDMTATEHTHIVNRSIYTLY